MRRRDIFTDQEVQGVLRWVSSYLVAWKAEPTYVVLGQILRDGW